MYTDACQQENDIAIYPHEFDKLQQNVTIVFSILRDGPSLSPGLIIYIHVRIENMMLLCGLTHL